MLEKLFVRNRIENEVSGVCTLTFGLWTLEIQYPMGGKLSWDPDSCLCLPIPPAPNETERRSFIAEYWLKKPSNNRF